MQLYIRKTSINPNRFKYKVNYDFFKHWNPRMAYILGFAFADGNIYSLSLGWDLKNDIELLKKINKAMGSNYPIEKRKNSFRLRISNPVILQDIQKLGVTPNKSKTCQLPAVPKIFFRDFIRGVLDGDGWVTIRKKKREISIGFCSGSFKFLRDLIERLNEFLSLTINNLRIKKKTIKKGNLSVTYEIMWYAQNALKIIKFLYDDLVSNF